MEKFFSDFKIESTEKVLSREQLLARLANVRNEISRLNRQIEALVEESKRIDGILSQMNPIRIAPLEYEQPEVDSESDYDDKFAVYRKYFDGRSDVYARRRTRDSKTFFYPVCTNAWTERCIISKYRNTDNGRKGSPCHGCPSLSYAPLTADVLKKNHFRNINMMGDGAVGMYVMHPDSTCSFLVIDMDDGDWEEDSRAILSIAREAGFSMVPERSFSGNGVHLWLFFSQRIPASKARELAFSFIENASIRYRNISMKSYDRVFPTQDKLSKNGLGNLVLLPFVYSGSLKGNTVFLDDDYHVLEEQFSFLSSLHRHSLEEVESYLLKQKSVFPDTLFGEGDEEKIEPLWQRKLPLLSSNDITRDRMIIHLGSGLSLSKHSLGNGMLHFLRKMSSFANPEYFRLQHAYDGYVPKNESSSIATFVETDDTFWLPRAFESQLCGYLNRFGIPYEIQDHRISSHDLDVEMGSDLILRDSQKKALSALTAEREGILNAATAFGKTVVATALIAMLKERTLVLVNSKELVSQWKKKLEENLEIRNEVPDQYRKRKNLEGIGSLGGGTDCITTLVDVATIQTVASRCRKERPSFLDRYGLVIVDECHHAAADTFCFALRNLRPRYLYGLSATVERRSGDEKIVLAHCGKVAYEYSAAKQAFENGLAQFMTPRFTNSKASGHRGNPRDLFSELSKDGNRNALIVSDIEKDYREGRKILVLSELVEHVSTISGLLEERNIPHFEITGRLSGKEMAGRMSDVRGDTGGSHVVVATSKIIGEGVDIPHLDTLFIALPVSFKGVITQMAGRIARPFEGKREVRIMDYVDSNIPEMEKMYFRRLKTYRKLGYMVGTSEEDIGALFSQKDYLFPLLASISMARKSIMVSSGILVPSRGTKETIRVIGSAEARCKTVIAGHPDTSSYLERHNSVISSLQKAGIRILEKEGKVHDFLIIDEEEIWYGDVGFLAVPAEENKSDDRLIIHFYDRKVAQEMISDAGLFL